MHPRGINVNMKFTHFYNRIIFLDIKTNEILTALSRSPKNLDNV